MAGYWLVSILLLAQICVIQLTEIRNISFYNYSKSLLLPAIILPSLKTSLNLALENRDVWCHYLHRPSNETRAQVVT
ncbi:hypothetical protein BDN71DRAFT_516195 [Pleurotus eryngii]|uniref:Secreted protein n=1 Tax=Pleurotus eryngii TaxID=5323 RepID=A0A9P6A572_PLEER|nr:hypothetical protein BDN71DRAFT_516195 [Pleurotus eryngii]